MVLYVGHLNRHRLIRTGYYNRDEHRGCGSAGILAAVHLLDPAHGLPRPQIPQEVAAPVPAVAPGPQNQITTIAPTPPPHKIPAKLQSLPVANHPPVLADSQGMSADPHPYHQYLHGGPGAAAQLSAGGAVRDTH